MLLGHKIHSDKNLAIVIFTLVGLLAISLFSNAVVGALAIKLYREQRVVTLPMGANQAFSTSIASADTYYLKMTALSFLSLRLTVTPETVEASHKELLSYVSPDARPAIAKALAADAIVIKESNLSTGFYMENYEISPLDGAFIVTGLLKSTTGDKPLMPLRKKYKLLMRYYNGSTELLEFSEIKQDEK